MSVSMLDALQEYALREDACFCGERKGHAGWLVCVQNSVGPDIDDIPVVVPAHVAKRLRASKPEPHPKVWCPHCDNHRGMCRKADGTIDRTAWTQEEKDAWRADAKRRDPALTFAPSSQQFAERFGRHNRR